MWKDHLPVALVSTVVVLVLSVLLPHLLGKVNVQGVNQVNANLVANRANLLGTGVVVFLSVWGAAYGMEVYNRRM